MGDATRAVPESLDYKLSRDLARLLGAKPRLRGADRGTESSETSFGIVAGARAITEPLTNSGLEAIIIADPFRRPALLVRNNSYENADAPTWRAVLDPNRTKLERALLSVGRLELVGHPTFNYVGTAWMIGENIAITNRHVASIFARRQGKSYAFQSGPSGKISALIDFREEAGVVASQEIRVEKVLYIADDGDASPDIGIIQVAKGRGVPRPIPLYSKKVQPKQTVAVIGYPANDPRNPQSAVTNIFGSIFEVKRLAPGEITANPKGFIVEHDCSTLGGNSGSVVLDVETGHAVGLHFGGRFRQSNYAVEVSELKKVLAKLKVSVSVPEIPQPRPEPEAIPVSRLEGRKGYQETFLGRNKAISIPLPGLPAALANQVVKVKNTKDNVLRYMHFSIVMSAVRRFAFFTACNIDGRLLKNISRSDNWVFDPRIAAEDQVGNDLYKNNDLDRGHLVRRLDPVWGSDADANMANDDSFFYTNATPQHARLNQGHWLGLEDYILNNTNAHDLKVSVFTGPIFADDDPEYRGVLLPQAFWKVVAVINGDTGKLHATGYILSQRDLISNLEFVFGQFRTYQVPIAEVENQTSLKLTKLKAADPLRLLEGPMALREIVRLEDIVL